MTYEPFMRFPWPQSGWMCPGCGRCYNPIVTQCSECGPQKITTGGSIELEDMEDENGR